MKKTNMSSLICKRFGDFDAIMQDVLLPLAAKRFRAKTPFLNTIHLDAASEVQKLGDTIKIEMPYNLGEMDRLEKGGEANATDYSAQTVELKIDTHGYKEFSVNDRNFSTQASQNTLPGLMAAAVDSVASGVNKQALALSSSIYNFVGTANGNSKSTNNIIDAGDFLDGFAPDEDRYLALHRKTNGDILKEMKDKSVYGETGAATGQVGAWGGFSIFKDIGVKQHVSGGAASANHITANAAAGDIAVAVSGGTYTKGDVFTIAGAETQHVVTEARTGAGVLKFYPALKTSVLNNAVITVQASHTLDMAYHKSAFAVAFRQLAASDSDVVKEYPYIDPVTGIPMRVVKFYDHKIRSVNYSFETLFGTGLTRPEWAVRVLN